MAYTQLTRLLFPTLASLLVCACANNNALYPERPTFDLYDAASIEQQKDFKQAAEDSSVTTTIPDDANKKEGKLIYYRGRSGALQQLGARNEDRLVGKTLQLNFVNAPASDAARTIIREALEETVSIADGVSGVITITAPEPVSAREALDALELALAESGLALIEMSPGFLLTTLENAGATPQAPTQRGPTGYATTIASVKHGTPSEIARLIEPFLTSRIALTPNDDEGVIIIRGPKVDADEALEAIDTFDAPYLTDRIFGLFKLEFADAETVRKEVETLLIATGVSAQDGTGVIALPRLNMLFVSARSKEAFAEARGWLERFDQPSGGDKRRLRYYPVQYTPAETLASQLNAAFGGPSTSFGASASSGNEPNRLDDTPQRNSSFRGANTSPLSGDRASIATDTLNNALIIRATDQEYAEILSLIQKMDMPAPQVLIEATIAEVTLNDDLAYGVRWFFNNAESAVSFPAGAAPSSVLSPISPSLNYSYFDNNVGVALNTLASVTDVTVLSAPSIMVLNNQAATLQVGDEVPIVTQQAQSVVDSGAPIVSTLQLRETGVILEVKPRVNASDVVVIDITQEVSDVAQTTTSGIDSPTIQQRRFTSTVSVQDNGTVALGGLIRETYTDNSSGVPVLRDVPLLGLAFKSREITKRRTELIVFLTPHIIRNAGDAGDSFRLLKSKMQNLYKDDQQAPTN